MVARVGSIARGQFYYGWVIVAVGFVTQFMVSGLQAYIFSVFFKPMSDELGWSRTTYSGVQSLGLLVNAVVSPLVGPVIDKRGARGLLIVGTIISAASYGALGLTRGLLDFYLIRGVIALGFSIGGNVTVNVAICNWFIRKRGKAVAAGIMGSSFGGVVLPSVATFLILTFGWRPAWAFIGLAILVLVIPPVVLFMKRRPEDIGLLPDGASPSRDTPPESPKGVAPRNLPAEDTWTRAEAVRTSALWLTIFAFALGTMGISSMLLHLVPFLTDIGVTTAAATAALSTWGLWSFSCKPAWGILIDRYYARHCGTAFFAFGAVAWTAYLLLSHWPFLWLVFVAASLGGIATGGTTTIQEVLWASYFGRPSLGAIRTIGEPFRVVFSAFAPLFAGWAYDHFGSYQLALAFFAASSAVGSILIYVARPPKKAAQAVLSGGSFMERR